MSRVGRQSIILPKGVEVKIDGRSLMVKGAKGSLTRDIPFGLEVVKDNENLIIKRTAETLKQRSLHGLMRALVFNMVKGVSEGFVKELELAGVGYRAALAGNKLSLQLGFSHPLEIDPPKGISFEVNNQVRIKVIGVDKELVGQVAAGVRKIRGAEPYKGKGIKYMGEHIRRKAGKAAKTASAGAGG